MDKCFQILTSLSEIAGETEKNKYEVIDFAFGFIPFKNGVNMSQEIGNSFLRIARWLLDETEDNLLK